MKYCLSGRQRKDFLKKADEIMVQGKDHRIITEYFTDYPDTMIILDIKREEIEALKKNILMYAEVSENFCCKIYDLEEAQWFKNNSIKFYYAYAIDNYYDLKGLVDLGVEYVKIGAPLTFDIPTLEKYYNKTKFRMVPNIAYSAYIPRQNGLKGGWVRPEDVEYYEKAIYVLEFEDIERADKERTLYKIYAEDKEWNDNLNPLITNLNLDIVNSFLPNEFGEIRSRCRQRCMQNGNFCWFCDTATRFQKSMFHKSFIDNFSDFSQKNKIDFL